MTARRRTKLTAEQKGQAFMYAPDGRPEDVKRDNAFHASLVMAGIAAESCTCTDKKHDSCGLSQVISMLGTAEEAREFERY